MPSSEERFRAKVKRRNGHDVWTGSTDPRGVGMVRIDGKLRTVQRAAWEFAYGQLPDGARVNTCAGERACVTLSHLSINATSVPPAKPRRRRTGSGSLREVTPGTWELSITDRTSLHGRHHVTVDGTFTDAEDHLASVQSLLARTDLGDLRIRELVGRHLENDGRIAPRDTSLLRDVIEPVLGDDLAALVTPERIETAFDDAGRDGTPPPDVRDALRLLRRTFQWATRMRWCEHDPTAGIDTRWLGR